jgi:hypothetical protein
VATTDQSEGVEKMLKEILRGDNGSKRRRREDAQRDSPDGSGADTLDTKEIKCGNVDTTV